jgi:multidrug efflux system membrane fusion protein
MQAITFKDAKVTLLGALLLAFMAGCDSQGQDNAASTAPRPEVEVAEVQAERVTLWGAFSGRVEAPQTVELRPRVSGFIDQVGFEEGELVSEGDVLFVIDPRPYAGSVSSLTDRHQGELAPAGCGLNPRL